MRIHRSRSRSRRGSVRFIASGARRPTARPSRAASVADQACPHALFYVGSRVPWRPRFEKAVSLGGSRVVGPAANPNGKLVVGHLQTLEGNLIVAGPA